MIEPIGEPISLPNGDVVPLSPGIRANGFLFVSGQLGFDEKGALVKGGAREQTRQAILNVEKVLKLGGASLEQVVKVTGWLTSADDFAAYNSVYAECFGTRPPARSMVVSSLLIPGAVVEIEAVAVVA